MYIFLQDLQSAWETFLWPFKNGMLRPMIYGMIFAVQTAIGNIRAREKRLLMQYCIAKPSMRGLRYPIEYFFEVLPKYGFQDVELAVFVTKSNNDPHPFLFARKKV